MFDKILLPIDVNHRESWEKAIPMARQCAGSEGDIHLLGIVHDLGSAMVSSFLPEDFEKKAMESLKMRLSELAEKEFPAGAKVQTHVGHGHVPETILRIADQIDADLIVMASHPPNDLQTLLVGSNADKVVRHATIPVLTVR
ncbi:Nucleotide-binding universal stress protein, UspA family [Cognatiyoonia koreensis]|uniref:Nucleotide-binding universal stress protein, UspA family n=1 Tax=Cognatiyoonia koreensis TaxID=364200 RepID=A0A1I0PWT5_9RHOB|nr:universal stress protein [Cognatiyoonia koreensis]SEW18866.1 Nucleotide-binding universal stress protein, UspA family [Cognatiyoonia koreensis]